MTDNDKKKFFEIMTGLAENFSAQLSAPGLRLRFAALERYSIDQIESSSIKLLHTRNIMGMPTVAEFIAAIEGERKPEDKATAQVNEIMRQVRDVGSYRTPAFDDPITDSLMNTRWSWQAVCAMTQTEHKWFAKDFIEAYQAYGRAEKPMIDNGIESRQRLRLLAGGIGK